MSAPDYTPKDAARFWSKVDISAGPDACWLWTGSTTHGYGQMWWDKKLEQTHRIAYRLSIGDIPDGLWVLHSCDNPPCCNPAHLWLGTNQDNVDDRQRKGRNKPRVPSLTKPAHSDPRAKTRHEPRYIYGQEHHNAKLTDEQVNEIRQLYASGVTTYRKLAEDFGVSDIHIWRLLKHHNRP